MDGLDTQIRPRNRLGSSSLVSAKVPGVWPLTLTLTPRLKTLRLRYLCRLCPFTAVTDQPKPGGVYFFCHSRFGQAVLKSLTDGTHRPLIQKCGSGCARELKTHARFSVRMDKRRRLSPLSFFFQCYRAQRFVGWRIWPCVNSSKAMNFLVHFAENSFSMKLW